MMAIATQKDGIRHERRVVDAQEAESILANHNSHNRNLRPNYVRQLAGAMTRGEWIYNGDPLRFDKEEELVDGQHRLAAVVASGRAQMFDMIHGLDWASQETMDSGARRSFGDVLKLRGETEVSRLAGAVRLLHYYRIRQTFRQPAVPPTAQELLATYARHPDLRGALGSGTRTTAEAVGLRPSPATVCLYLFRLVDLDDAEVFYSRLRSGADLAERDPILALRRLLTAPRPHSRGLGSDVQGAVLIKTWNAWRNGEGRTIVAWRPGGATAERFPQVDGLDPSVL